MADESTNKYPLEWQAGIDTSTRFDADSAKVVAKLNEINAKISKTEQDALKQVLDNAKIATAETKEQLNQLLNSAKVRETEAKAAAAEEKLRQQQIQTDIKASLQLQQEYKAEIQSIALENKRIAAEEIAASKAKRQAVISDTQAEIDAYYNPVQTGSSGFNALNTLDEKIKRVNADFEAGVINANQYRNALNQLNSAAASDPLRNSGQNIGNGTTIAGLERELGIKQQLILTEKELKAAITTETDIAALASLNLRLQETQAELVRMANIGKIGFDELGNKIVETQTKLTPFERAIARATNASALAGRVVTSLTRQIVGLGVGLLSFAVGAKAIEFLTEYIKNLDYFSGRLDQAKQNLSAFNDVNKSADQDAGKQITNLKILYQAATDVTNSTKERIAAARELQKEFPNEFANANALAIVNGKLKGSYDDLSASILQQARAAAAAAKIQELTAKQLDNQFQIDKNNAVKYNELNRVKGVINGGSAGVGAAGIALTEEQQKRAIKARTDNANLEATQNNKILQGQIDFLIKYVGGNEKLAEALEKSTATSDKKKADADAKRAAAAGARELQARQKLLDSIADLENKYSAKAINREDSEVAAIHNDFQRKIREVEEYNSKIKDAAKKLPTIGLKKEEIKAIENARENQFFQAYKDDLDAQKKIFDDFENYKLRVGSEKAEARFAKELNGNKSFIDYLNQQLADTINPNDKSKATSDRRGLLQKELTDAYTAQSANYTKLLESFNSYQSQIENLTATHNDKLKQLAGNKEATQDEILSYNQQKDALEASLSDRIGKIEGYNNHVIELTRKQAKAQIAALKDIQVSDPNLTGTQNTDIDANIAKLQTALATSGGLTKNYREDLLRNKQILLDQLKPLETTSQKWTEIQEKIALINAQLKATNTNEFQKDVKKVSDYADSASQGFSTLANSLSEINPGLSDTLATLGEITKTIGDGAKLAGSIASGDPIGIITGVANVASDLIGLFTRGRKSAQEAQAAIQKYNDDLLKSTIDYNILLRTQKDLQEDITKLTSQQLKDRIALLNTSKSQSQSDYNTLLSQIQNSGQQITGVHTEKYGGFLGAFQKTKVVQDLAGLGNAGYDDLLKLYTEGKLTDSTKSWFEELQKVHDEMQTIGEDAKAAKDQLDQIATGTTSDSIASAIIDGFKKGYKTAADFADTFKDLMQQALLSTFEVDYLKPKIAEFYKNFAALSEDSDGLTQADIDALRSQYATIIANSASQISNITAITGPLGSTNANTNTISGAISTASQQSIDLLAGQLGGLRLAQLESNAIETKILAMVTSSDSSGKRMIDISQKMLDQLIDIERNTGITASFAPFLKTIAQNTYDNTSVNLRAAGLTAVPTR